MKNTFDLDEALEAIKAGAAIDGKDGILAPLIKQLTEAALEAELETHLGNEIRNRKNGKSSKRMKSSAGEFELEVPRDRNGTFEPQFVKKHQTHMSDQIERKILSLYALGNISEHIEFHQPGRPGGDGLRTDQQVRRGLSRQALLRRLRERRQGGGAGDRAGARSLRRRARQRPAPLGDAGQHGGLFRRPLPR